MGSFIGEEMIIDHILKIDESYANAIMSGDKLFEIRFNDRGYQRGHKIKFTCNLRPHEIDKMVYEITYLFHAFGLEDGWCVFGIKEIKE